MTVFTALAGCAVNPNTGRSQLMVLPAAQSVHANIGYALASAAGPAPSPACIGFDAVEPLPDQAALPCASAAQSAKFARQVDRIGAELSTEARELAPELFTRVRSFHIEVATGIGSGTASSAGGRIAIDAELAALDPTDDVVAFLIAREMGHVIARHGEENSGAKMAASALVALVPVGGFVVKMAISLLGSQALTTRWAESQRREADELALALLERCDRSPGVVAFNLRAGFRRERLPAGEWGMYLAQSIERVGAIVRARSKENQLAAVK